MTNIKCLMLEPKFGCIIAYYKIWPQKTNKQILHKKINHSYYYSKDWCVKKIYKNLREFYESHSNKYNWIKS